MLFKGKQNHNPSLRTHTLLDTHTQKNSSQCDNLFQTRELSTMGVAQGRGSE